MSLKFNPVTGELDLVESTDVSGKMNIDFSNAAAAANTISMGGFGITNALGVTASSGADMTLSSATAQNLVLQSGAIVTNYNDQANPHSIPALLGLPTFFYSSIITPSFIGESIALGGSSSGIYGIGTSDTADAGGTASTAVFAGAYTGAGAGNGGKVYITGGPSTNAANSGVTGEVLVKSGPNLSTTTGSTGPVRIGSSNVTGGTGTSGDFFASTGNQGGTGPSGDWVATIGSSSGAQGDFKFIKNGATAPFVNDVFTCSDVDGSGYWAAPVASGANDTLSNLASPTSINQHLIPNGAKTLGNATNFWLTGYVSNFNDSSGFASVSPASRTLNKPDGTLSLDFNSNLQIRASVKIRPVLNNTIDLGDSGQNWLSVHSRSLQSNDNLALTVPNTKVFKILESGNAPSVNDVFTCSDVDGSGYWATPAAGLAQDIDGIVSTTDATLTTIFTLPTTSDKAYLGGILITARDSVGNVNTFSGYWDGKNVGGVMTTNGFDIISGTFADIVGAAVSQATSGTNILFQVTGVAATNIDWTFSSNYNEG